MNELTIATTTPVSDDELQARLRQIREYKADAIKTVDAAKDALTADNYRKEKLNAFDNIDKKLKALSESVGNAAMPDWAKALLVEVAAARNEVKACVTARQDRLRELKAQYGIPDPRHSYVIQCDVTDADFKRIVKAIGDNPMRWVVADGQDAKINKAFAALGWVSAAGPQA